MKTIKIELPEPLARWLAEEIAARRFASPSEAAAVGLELLRARQDARNAEAEALETLRSDLQKGLDSGKAPPASLSEILTDARAWRDRNEAGDQ